MTNLEKNPTLALSVAAGGIGLALLTPLLFGSGTKKEKQVILVTGASSGIGKETALKLIAEGHIVYGAARRVDKMKELVDAGGHAIAMDVCDTKQIESGIKTILSEQNNRIDALINNAGYAVYGSIEDISLEDARRQFEVNMFGLADLTKAVLPIMRAQKSGTIINVSSMGGKVYSPFGAWYHATKHALEAWSDCLRLEVSDFGINVVIVEPGAIGTEFDKVLTQPMIDRSKGGPYEHKVMSFVKTAEGMLSQASHPSVIANVMLKAVQSKSPKRRYVAGNLARPMIFLRSWFGDGFFDFMLKSMMK